MTLEELRSAAAEWVDRESDIVNCRLLDVSREGFHFDAEGFFSPRYKSFADAYAEYWMLLARRRIRGERRRGGR